MKTIAYPPIEEILRRWKKYFGYDHPKRTPITTVRDKSGRIIISVNKKYYQRYIKDG